MERKTLDKFIIERYTLCGCKRQQGDTSLICRECLFTLEHYISDIDSWNTLGTLVNKLLENKDDGNNQKILNALRLGIKYSGIAKIISENKYLMSILK